MTTPTLLLRAGAVADEVRAEARQVDLVKVLLTLLAVLPFLLGLAAGFLVRCLLAAFAWTWAAVLVGWRTAQRGEDGGG